MKAFSIETSRPFNTLKYKIMWNLNNKKVFITGGTKGIGRATVLEMAGLGAKVLFTARNEEEVSAFEQELRGMHYDAFGLTGDVADTIHQQAIVDWIDEQWGTLDVLVNNAGINIRKTALEYTAEEYTKILHINLTAPFELSRRLHPYLIQGNSPAIVNVASIAGRLDVHTGSPYGMSKAGLIQQTKNLAVEWAQYGIRANAVSPWFTETPLTEVVLKSEERMQQIIQRTPLKRVAKAEEMASVIAFLAMDKSSYITGQNIIVDGGMSVNAL
jgi:Tropinone reductase 1